jgi:hypothetical protein
MDDEELTNALIAVIWPYLVDVLPALTDGDSRLLSSLLVGSGCLRCP